jgi:hypothetical protein
MNKKEPVCGDCPDYKAVDTHTGRCPVLDFFPGYHHPVCLPRSRELEALEKIEELEDEVGGKILEQKKAEREVKRLREKLEAMADILSPTVSRPGVPSMLYCPPLHECPEDLSISCRQCWQMWIES